MKTIWQRFRHLTRNPTEQRPRALIRLGLHTSIATVFLVFGSIPLLLWGVKTGRITFEQAKSQDLGVFLTSDLSALSITVFFQSLAVILAVLIAVRWIDRRGAGDLGLKGGRRWWRDFGFGSLLGFALMTGIFLFQSAAGWTETTGSFAVRPGNPDFATTIGDMLVLCLLIAFSEELLTRGYWIKNLSEGLHRPEKMPVSKTVLLVWAGSAVVFGLGHAINPNATVTGVIGTALAGLVLGLPFVLTGELGLSVGLHFAWNFSQGCVFGFPVSGIPVQASLVATKTTGPAVWTGGAFGPEAGLTGILALVVGAAAILLWIRRTRGELRIEPSLVTPTLRPKAPKKPRRATSCGDSSLAAVGCTVQEPRTRAASSSSMQ